MRRPTRVLACTAAFFLAACADGTVTNYVSYDAAGLPGLFQYAASGRDFRTIVRGNPGGASKDAFDAAVIAAMQGHVMGRTTHFTATPSAEAREGYRVVMAFGGDRPMGGDAACRGGGGDGLAPGAGSVGLQAAFCYRERVLSQVYVAFPAETDPHGPMLRRAVAEAVGLLFPLHDPARRPDADDRDPVVPP